MLSVHIGVVGQFPANAGGLAVTGIDGGVVGQLGKQTQAVDDLKHGTAGEVGASNACLEECVTGESHVFFFAVEGDRAP